MNKLAKILIAAAVAVVVLAGCGKQLTEGEVYEKQFIPAHTQRMVIPHRIYNGKTSTTILIPYIRYYPDTWKVYIKAFQDDEWKTTSYCVPEDTYNQVQIGQVFEYDVERDLKEAPYTQEREEG